MFLVSSRLPPPLDPAATRVKPACNSLTSLCISSVFGYSYLFVPHLTRLGSRQTLQLLRMLQEVMPPRVIARRPACPPACLCPCYHLSPPPDTRLSALLSPGTCPSARVTDKILHLLNRYCPPLPPRPLVLLSFPLYCPLYC